MSDTTLSPHHPVRLELELERDHCVRKAQNVLDSGVAALDRLSHELELALRGDSYRPVAGAGQRAMNPLVIDVATIGAAFDAVERCASLFGSDGQQST